MAMSKKFKEYSHLDLSQINKDILEKWDENNVFDKSMQEREGCPSFVFYEGPPSANGMPGIHHVMARTLKDTVCRYKTMKGYQVKRKAGWDTHGLPVELSVEKNLGITKVDIGEKISVADYNAACRKDVMKFTKEWTDLTHKMGYWVDTTDPYITYDNRYIETLWWLLSQLHKKGLLYKGYTIQPYSPAAGTGLSSHELNMPGCYKDVKDSTLTAQFKIKNPGEEMKGWGTAVFIAWTTTPWTLPSNTALCVGPKIDYVAVRSYNPYTYEKITAIVAEPLLYAHFNKEGEDKPLDTYKEGDKIIPFEIAARYKGSDLVGLEYEQLFPWVKPIEVNENGEWKEASAKAFRVIPGDYVTTEDGTGIVHIAPTFGADDANVARAAGIPPLFVVNKKGKPCPMVDLEGKFYELDKLDEKFISECVNTDQYANYQGQWVKNAYDPQFTKDGRWDEKASAKAESLDLRLSLELKVTGRAFELQKHVHNYPHCWRTDKPVLYYPLDSWFIRSTAVKDRMIELNKTINWKPESTGTGRFGKWLENLNDWNLSRSRYWGTPLPIWRNEEGDEKCIGSVEELYSEIEKSVEAGYMKTNPLDDAGFKPGEYNSANYDKIDLHRPHVDNVILVGQHGPMRREEDLIDVWFDSGAMPYAQLHYPFENKEIIDNRSYYPADFIAEGVDQTRGWFFTLHAIATMVFDSVAFKNVISNGLVLDKDGNKMSKRLGNAVEPFGAIDKYGSDPLRWYMITNSSPWDNLKFDEAGVDEVRRKFFGTLYNTYSFFTLYANVDGFDNSQTQVPMQDRQEIDRWIISELNTLIKKVDNDLAAYEPTKAGRLINDFVNDNLSNWYVRLSRKRFWGSEMSIDKLSAYQTLYTCLETVAKLMAPISPFYADRLYTDLTEVTGRNEGIPSVHLATYPEADETLIDKQLEARMEKAQKITSMVLALRRKVNIKVRQPLQSIMIPVTSEEMQKQIEDVKSLILGEVNVKEIKFVGSDAGILVKSVKPNFKVLGPKFGKQMKLVAKAINSLSQEEINALENNGRIQIDLGGEKAEILSSEVDIINEDIPGWLVSNEGILTVALEIELTDALKKEGTARELVNRIQNIRKESGFEITDHIIVTLQSHPETDAAMQEFRDYISGQVLADEIHTAEQVDGGLELDMEDYKLQIKVEKK